jgi:hypothetical protein
MTRPQMQGSRRFVWFPLCGILVGLFACDGNAQPGGSVFPPPSPAGANWLTCTISGSTLTLGAATGQTSHQVIGTCGSATSFAPCSLVAGDLPSIPLATGVTGTLPAANLPAPAGGGPPGGVAAITSATSPINTPETTVVSYTVPANTIAAGTTYRVVAYGTCTSTAANVSAPKIRFGSTGTTSDTALATFSVTAATSGSNVAFSVEFYITFQSTTVAEVTAILHNNGSTGIYTALQNVMTPANTTGLTTTSNEVLQLAYASAATTTTSTFYIATIELVKP